VVVVVVEGVVVVVVVVVVAITALVATKFETASRASMSTVPGASVVVNRNGELSPRPLSWNSCC